MVTYYPQKPRSQDELFLAVHMFVRVQNVCRYR